MYIILLQFFASKASKWM